MEKKYNEVREEIINGDLIFFRSNTILSRIIQLAGRSSYNHVGMAAWWNDRLMILETCSYGCRACLLSNIIKKYSGKVDIYRVHYIRKEDEKDVISDIRKNAVSLMIDATGNDYGWKALLKTAWTHVPIVRWFQKPNTNDLHLSNSPLYCSSVVSESYRKAGLDIVPNLADDRTEPGDLARSGVVEYRFTPIEG